MPNTPIFRTSLRTPILISCFGLWNGHLDLRGRPTPPRHGKMLKADRHTESCALRLWRDPQLRSPRRQSLWMLLSFLFCLFIMLWVFSSQRTKFLSQPMPVVVSVAFFGLQRSAAAAVRYPDICVCFGCVCSTLLSGKDFSSFKF
jgi:hypothetical protein